MSKYAIYEASHRTNLQILWLHKSYNSKRKLSRSCTNEVYRNRFREYRPCYLLIFANSLRARRSVEKTIRSAMADEFNLCNLSSYFNHLGCYVKEEE
jgi:hypothetical protein